MRAYLTSRNKCRWMEGEGRVKGEGQEVVVRGQMMLTQRAISRLWLLFGPTKILRGFE